jgi:hypothetical protein
LDFAAQSGTLIDRLEKVEELFGRPGQDISSRLVTDQ